MEPFKFRSRGGRSLTDVERAERLRYLFREGVRWGILILVIALMGKPLVISEDELRQILGARETNRIAKELEALRAPEVRVDQLEALAAWIGDPNSLGQGHIKIVPALRAFYQLNPTAKRPVKKWLVEMGVK